MKFPLFGVSPVLLLDTGNLSHSGHQNNANVGPPRRNQHFKDLGDLRLNTDGVKSDDTVKKIKLSLSAPSQSSPAQNAKRKARDVLNGLLPCDDHGRIAPGTLVPGSLTYSLWACAVLVTNFTSTNLDPLDPSSHAPDQAGVSAGCVPVLPRALDSWLTNDGRREANSKIANELLNWRNYIACEVNVSTLKSALNAPELPVECQERKDLSAALATQQKELSKLQDKFSRSTGINSIANQKLTGWIRDVIGNSLSSANFIPSAVLSQARINGNYSTANLMNAAPGLEILGQIVAGTGLSLSVLSGITNALQGIGEIRDQYTRLDQLTEWKNREKQALFSLISRCSDSDGVAQASVPVAREVAALREQYRQFGSRDRKLLHEAGTSRVLQALCTNGTSMAAGGIQLGAAIAGASAALAPVTMGLTIASAILSAVYLAAVTWRIERQKRARKEFTKWQGKLKANICDIDGQPGELYTRIKTQIKVSKPFRQYLQAIGVPSELVEEIQKAPEQREGELANRLIAALLREPRSDADDKAVIRNTWEDADASTRWHIYAFWKAKGWPLAEIRMKTDSSGSDKPWIRKLAKGADAADIWKANIDAKEFATWWSYKDPKKKEDPQKKEDSEKEEEDFRTFAVRSVQTSAKTLFAMVPSLETDLLPVSPSSDQVFKAIGQLKQLWEKYGAIRAKVDGWIRDRSEELKKYTGNEPPSGDEKLLYRVVKSRLQECDQSWEDLPVIWRELFRDKQPTICPENLDQWVAAAQQRIRGFEDLFGEAQGRLCAADRKLLASAKGNKNKAEQLRVLGKVWDVSEKLKAHPISKVVASLHAYPTPTTNVPDLVAREAAKRELTRRFNTADISRDGAAKKLFEQRLEFAQWVGDKSALHERSFLKGNGGQTLGVFGYASNDAGRAVIALLEESILGNPIDRSILFPSQVIVDALKIADTPDNPSRIKNVIQTWLDVRGLSGLYTTPKKEPGKELKKEPGKEPENMPGKEPEKKEVDAALSAVQTPEAFRRALKIGVPEKQEEFWAWRYATKFKEALQNGLQQQDSGLAAKVVDYFLWTGDMPKVEQLPSVPQSVREQLNSRWPFFEAALSYSGPTAAQAKNRAAVQEELKQVLMGKTEFISDKWSARFLSQLKPVGTDESLVERRRTILQSLGSVSGDESERDAIKQIFSLHSLKYDELTDENRLSWACAHFRKLGLQDQFIKERESISKKLMGKYIEEDFYDKLSTIADRLAEQKMRGQLETLLTKACNGDLDALFGLYVEEYLADPGSDAQNIAMIYWSRRESGQAQNDDEILKKWLIRYDKESSEFYTIFDLNDDGAGRMNSVAEAVADALNQRGTEQFIEKMEKADAIDNLNVTQKFSILERLHNEGLKKQGHKFCDRIADIITKIYRSLSIDEQAKCREQILKHWNIEYDADSDEFSEIFDLGETSNSGDAAMNRMAAAIAEAMNGNEESVLKERSLPDLWTYLAESE